MEKCNKGHGKVMEKVMEKSWNVMEFGFENCMGTLYKFGWGVVST